MGVLFYFKSLFTFVNNMRKKAATKTFSIRVKKKNHARLKNKFTPLIKKEDK